MRRLYIGLCLSVLVGCAASDERWGEYAPTIDVGASDAMGETDTMVRARDAVAPDTTPPEPDMAPPTDAGPPPPDMVPVETDMAPAEPDMAPPEPDMAPPEPDMAPPEPDMAPPDPDMALPEPDMAPPMLCADGDRRSVACGLNGRGMQPQRCSDDAWLDDGPCVDPDRCVDGTEEQEPCGLNDRGTRRRICVDGDFRPPEDCVDPDECLDDAVEERACGERGDGLESRRCDAGVWLDWGDCVGDCADVCVAGAVRCAGGAVETCADVDADPCLEWGLSTPCAAAQMCVDGACVGAPAGGIIINELYYDEVGGDGPGVFIELWGPPGAPLAGVQLEAINGANGQTYATIPLEGVIGEDGYYLVAAPEASPELAPLVDLFDDAADLQNGPDNLQLVDADGVLDAVAYGNVGANFFGETAGTADVPPGTALTRIAHGDTDDNSVDFVPRDPSPRAEP